jgi:hypothetical protein
MRYSKATGVFIAILSAVGLSSCSGGGGGSSTPPTQEQASVYSIGTDAPLPSVVSCEVTVTGITLNNGTTNVSVLTQPAVVDFAKLSGLHQLLDLTSVPTGTYSSATITISAPVIGYIDTTVNPPAVSTIDGTLSTNSVTVNFNQPVSVTSSDLFGLRMEFDLRQSLATDANGQITGAVNPVFEVALKNALTDEIPIDEFMGGVIGVTGANTFNIQGPHGRQWTVTTSDSTVLDDPTIAMNTFTTDTIVAVSGTIDPVTHNIDASEIDVVSMNKFYLDGLLTSVRPPSGGATAADLYVRDELPAINGISDGQIETLSLNGSENYHIEHINLPLTTLLFNNSALAAGQRVGISGSLTTTNGESQLAVKRVVLQRQGQAGTWVPGSTVIQNGNAGSFSLTDDWTAGVLLPQPLPVLTTNDTNFINLSGLSALSGASPIAIRVVGFILEDPATGLPVMVARSVEGLTASSN